MKKILIYLIFIIIAFFMIEILSKKSRKRKQEKGKLYTYKNNEKYKKKDL